MSSFPTTFTKPQQIKKSISPAADAAIDFLTGRGLMVLVGMDEQLASSITKMALEPHIKEYCPRDCTKDRFADSRSTKKWLSLGHAFFTLAKKNEDGGWRAVGYGWSGPKKTDKVPEGETTFALRIGREGLRQGLSSPFSQVVIDASVKLYGSKRVWLETWGSNEAAVHVYKKLGFELVNQKPGKRSTANGQEVDDTRLYMSLLGS